MQRILLELTLRRRRLLKVTGKRLQLLLILTSDCISTLKPQDASTSMSTRVVNDLERLLAEIMSVACIVVDSIVVVHGNVTG